MATLAALDHPTLRQIVVVGIRSVHKDQQLPDCRVGLSMVGDHWSSA